MGEASSLRWIKEQKIEMENEESETRDAPEELVPKRGAVSAVWKFFGFKKSDADQKTIYCKVCRATVFAAGGNTSNLLHHLSRKHVLEHQECMRLRSSDLRLSTSRATETVQSKGQTSRHVLDAPHMTGEANGGATL